MAKTPKDVGDEIAKAVAKATADLTAAEMYGIGQQAVNIMVLRTKKGLDADLKPFAPYAPDYEKVRTQKGLGTTPDLARSGHMLGAMLPQAETNKAVIRFASSLEEDKAATHNYGRQVNALVGAHSRSVYANAKTGQRASRGEIARDQRRKTRRLRQRTESVSSHRRQMGWPRREFFDVRHPSEVGALEESIGTALQGRIEKGFK